MTSVVMLSVIMLIFIMLNVTYKPYKLSVFMLSAVMLNIVMLSVMAPFMLGAVPLNVVMLRVVAPFIGYLGSRDSNGNTPICAALPKVPKASTVTVARGSFSANFANVTLVREPYDGEGSVQLTSLCQVV